MSLHSPLYFLDCEFNEETKDPPELISIGLVCSDNREFYAVNAAFDEATAPPWLKQNVVPVLDAVCGHRAGAAKIAPYKTGGNYFPTPRDVRMSLPEMRREVEQFCVGVSGEDRLDFWGYYADYDWYFLSRLFGGMMKMPKRFPMLCLDVKQWAYHLGVRDLPTPFEPQHNALVDARWTKRAWEYLRDGK